MDYIRQAILQALDSLCKKKSILKKTIQNNPTLDRSCIRNNLVTKLNCPYLSHQIRSKNQLLFWSFKIHSPLDNWTKAIKQTRCFTWKSSTNYKKENDLIICKRLGHFVRYFSQAKNLKDSIHFFEEITNHIGSYLYKEDVFEMVFSLEEELTMDILFSIYIYMKNQAISMPMISKMPLLAKAMISWLAKSAHSSYQELYFLEQQTVLLI